MIHPAQALGNYLKKNNLTVAFAESITCGLVTHRLGNIIGASAFLKGGIICYNEWIKCSVLNVKKTTLKKHTAESQEVTDVLAKNLRNIIEADIHGAITGLASAGGSEAPGKPVGTVFYAFYYNNKIYRLKKQFTGSPLSVKIKACNEFYNFILEELANEL